MTTAKPQPEEKSGFLLKIFYTIGLYLAFLVSGIFEEKLYKTTYLDQNNNKIKFNSPTLAIFLISIVSLIIARIMLWTKKASKDPFTETDKLMLGAYYMGSRFSSEYSLNYLDFISKIIGKSCKSVSSKYKY